MQLPTETVVHKPMLRVLLQSFKVRKFRRSRREDSRLVVVSREYSYCWLHAQ
jgi:hypothetical protein